MDCIIVNHTKYQSTGLGLGLSLDRERVLIVIAVLWAVKGILRFLILNKVCMSKSSILFYEQQAVTGN